MILGYFQGWRCAKPNNTINVIIFIFVCKANQGITAGLCMWNSRLIGSFNFLLYVASFPALSSFSSFFLQQKGAIKPFLERVSPFLGRRDPLHYRDSLVITGCAKIPSTKEETREKLLSLNLQEVKVDLHLLGYRTTESWNHRRVWTHPHKELPHNHPCSKELLAKTNY